MINYCDECQRVTPSDELKLIYKQEGGESHAKYVCPGCAIEHEKHLERCRQNFQAQFGEKPIQESSKEPVKTGTDVDIHKIIDDAMEKKDRSVTIFISSVGTSVYVNPYEDKPREWRPREDRVGYLCPECGGWHKYQTPYCSNCGEKLRRTH